MIGGAAVNRQFEATNADAVRDRVKSREIAEVALHGLSDKDKVHFALKLILDTTDPDAAGTLSFAANRIGMYIYRCAGGRSTPPLCVPCRVSTRGPRATS